MPSSADDEELIRLLAVAASKPHGTDVADAAIGLVKAEIETLEEEVRKTPPHDLYAEEPQFLEAIQKLAHCSSPPERSSQSPPEGAMRQELGTVGRYRLLEQLGAGGMGTVYKAIDPRLDRVVALKVLPAERMGTEAVARFQREARAMAKLQHDNIVRVFDADEHQGTHFLVMECIDGCDLSRLVRQHGSLQPTDACEIIRQAALGLAHAHEHGLVHRDIKPSNLMLTRGGQVKLLDLGLARLREEPHEGEELTAASQIMGTADYMAPEQAGDSHDVDIRADIYSLGCTLYRLVTGEVPYPSPEFKTNAQKVAGHIARPFPDVAAKQATVPAGLANVLRRMVAKQPDDRFATPAEVAAALAPFCAGSNPAALLRSLNDRPGDNAPTTPYLSATDDTTADRPAPRTPPTALPKARDTRNQRWLWISLAAAALIAAAATIIKIQTRDGVLVLTVDGDGAIVTVDGETAKVTLGDDKHTYRVAVQPGTHTLVVTTPEGIKYKTDNQFTVEAGSQTRLAAHLEKPPAIAPSTATAATPNDPDRAAAEWALNLGNRPSILIDGRRLQFSSAQELPKRQFKVMGLQLTSGIVLDEDLERLGQLTALRDLDLTGQTRITDDGLKFTEGLPALETLMLYKTQITDAAFDTIVTHKSLRQLSLGGTKTTARGWRRIQELPKLDGLYLEELPVTDANLAELVIARPELKALSLEMTNVSDAGLVHLGRLNGLKDLQLIGTQVTDTGLSHLVLLPALERIYLTDTKITNVGLTHVARMKTLRSIILNLNINEEGLEHLANLPQLKILTVSAVPENGGEQLSRMRELETLTVGYSCSDMMIKHLSGLPKLRSLRVGDPGVTDACVADLARMPALRSFVSYKAAFTDSGAEALAQMTQLKLLEVHHSLISPSGIAKLRRALPKTQIWWDPNPLKRDLIGAQQVLAWGGKVTIDALGKESLVESAVMLPAKDFKVTAIDLAGCKDVDETALEFLRFHPLLHAIDFRQAPITDVAIPYLISAKGLTRLDLRDTRITLAGVQSLQAALPKCKIEGGQ